MSFELQIICIWAPVNFINDAGAKIQAVVETAAKA